jgi:hypothetical protein
LLKRGYDDIIASQLATDDFLLSICYLAKPNAAVINELDAAEEQMSDEKDMRLENDRQGLDLQQYLSTSNAPVFGRFVEQSSCCLSMLDSLLPKGISGLQQPVRTEVASVIITFADASSPWVSPVANRLSLDMMEKFGWELSSREILIDGLLRDTIKPLFGKGPRTITSSGRKAMRSSERRPEDFQISEDKPWRRSHPETLSLLRFVVAHLHVSTRMNR